MNSNLEKFSSLFRNKEVLKLFEIARQDLPDYITGKIARPLPVKEKEVFIPLSNADLVSQWIGSVDIQPGKYPVSASEMFTHFNSWLNTMHPKQKALTHTAFGRQISNHLGKTRWAKGIFYGINRPIKNK